MSRTDYTSRADLSANGWHLTGTSDPRVFIGQWDTRHFRTLVRDDVSGWAPTGPPYPTKGEAYANVPAVAREYYGLIAGDVPPTAPPAAICCCGPDVPDVAAREGQGPTRGAERAQASTGRR